MGWLNSPCTKDPVKVLLYWQQEYVLKMGSTVHPVFQGTHQTKRQARPVDIVYAFLILLLAVVGLGLSPAAAFARQYIPNKRPLVLAYATNITTGDLLNATNQQRSANGVAALGLNAKLAQAAQTKANDMANRNYWSHDTPEGNPPWVFITAAGYSYNAAGENLAYGFLTSSDVVAGWMNSAGHRANMLNATYQEVGFGYANAANYQGQGEQTIVVAFYAQPTGAVQTTPPPPPPPPVPPPVVTKSITPAPAKPAPPPTPPIKPVNPSPTPSPVKVDPPQPPEPTSVLNTAPAPNLPAKQISRGQLLTRSQPWLSLGLGLIGSLAALYLVVSHSFMLHKMIRQGERFVLHHPLFDFVLIPLIVASIFLSQTVGFIH